MENEVKLIGYYGSDELIACSAWTSTSRELTPEKIARIPELLKMLADKGHHTPFEKSLLHFLVVCDTASHIHLLKHRISVSINTESARYKELTDKYLIPKDWPESERQALEDHMRDSYVMYHRTVDSLVEAGLTKKRAKESARFFLPYATQVMMDVSFNWRSFKHFLDLRKTEHAQVEIRQISEKMLQLVRDIPGNPFKHTLKAFYEE